MSERYLCVTWKNHQFLLCYHCDGEGPGGYNKVVQRSGVLAICYSKTETSRLLTWWNTKMYTLFFKVHH